VLCCRKVGGRGERTGPWADEGEERAGQPRKKENPVPPKKGAAKKRGKESLDHCGKWRKDQEGRQQTKVSTGPRLVSREEKRKKGERVGTGANSG